MTNAISQPYGCPPTWARVLRTIAVVFFWLPIIADSSLRSLLYELLEMDWDAINSFNKWFSIVIPGCYILGWGLLCAAGSDWIVRIGTLSLILCLNAYLFINTIGIDYWVFYALISWGLIHFLYVYGVSLLARHPQLERRIRVWCLLLVVSEIALQCNWISFREALDIYDSYDNQWLFASFSVISAWNKFTVTIFLMIAYWKVAHSPLFAGPQPSPRLGFRNFNPFNRVFFGALIASVLGLAILALYDRSLIHTFRWMLNF